MKVTRNGVTRTIPVTLKGKGNSAKKGTGSTVQIGAPAGVRRGGTPARNPGGNSFSQTQSRPVIEGTTSAWIRTLFDPAHARDFGCVGLPDENQTPTAVLSHRYDLVFSKSTILSPSLYVGAYVWKRTVSSGGAVGQTQQTTSANPSSASTITKVYVCNHPDIGVLVIVFGNLIYGSGDSQTTWDMFCGVLAEPNTFIQGLSVSNRTNARALSSSVTLSNVTSWSNIGGYFTGGNFPWTVEHENNNDILYLPVSIDSYATYTGEADAGAYVIARPRSIDQMKVFKGTEQFNLNFKFPDTTGATVGSAYTGLYSIHPAWDWSYACYCPCDTNTWTIRLTWFGNYEVTRPYSEGGQDGAVFDKATLELAIAMCDNMTFAFPASYNDLGLLMPVLKKMAHAAVGRITSGMGLTPSMARDVQRLIDSLLNRKSARKQLSTSYAVL